MTRYTETQLRVESIDAKLAKDVQDSMYASRNGLRRVGVSAEDGVIRLSGLVPTSFLRQSAIAIAKRVDGVRGIVDELIVEQYPSHSRSRNVK